MKTAEEILNEAYFLIKENQNSQHCAIDPILISAMEEYAEQFKPKWISVKDRLPKRGDYVLAANYRGMDIAEYANDLFFIGLEATISTTDWMPLPEAPKI